LVFQFGVLELCLGDQSPPVATELAPSNLVAPL